jgi:tetratricopeptide (TPR) repeat protein
MRVLLTASVCALALAACERADDPAARQAEACADAARMAEERVAACTAAIESGSLDEEARVVARAHRGAAYYEAGQVTPALRDFEAVLRDDPHNAEALEGRAAILLASGQLDAAMQLVERLIASGERLDQAHLMRGDIAFQHGDYTGAIGAYGDAIRRNGDLALAYAHRARTKQRLEDHAGALTDFDMAVRLDGDLVDARAGRCWLSLVQDEQLERARQDAETAVAAAPENVEAQLCRGVLQLRGGDWANARAAFEAALAVEPGNPTALFGRGVARRRSGDNDGRDDMNRARDFDRHIGERFDELRVATF